jgi:hypothetical protein
VTAAAAFASFSTVATATFGSTTAFVSQTATAIATYDGWGAAEYAVTLDVNGYASGFNLVNGGGGISTFTVVADKFQIQLPGYNGNLPSAVFTVGTVNGVAAVGINGANMYLDGTLNARAIVAGSITSASGAIGALSVNALSIGDNAITVPATQSLTSNVSPTPLTNLTLVSSVTLSIDTTGLAGKTDRNCGRLQRRGILHQLLLWQRRSPDQRLQRVQLRVHPAADPDPWCDGHRADHRDGRRHEHHRGGVFRDRRRRSRQQGHPADAHHLGHGGKAMTTYIHYRKAMARSSAGRLAYPSRRRSPTWPRLHWRMSSRQTRAASGLMLLPWASSIKTLTTSPRAWRRPPMICAAASRASSRPPTSS